VASLALPWFPPPEILSLKVATFKGGRSDLSRRIRKGLRERGYEVWIDLERTSVLAYGSLA
jgi:hypothetical protein